MFFFLAAIDEYYDLKKEFSHISRNASKLSGTLEEGITSRDDFNLGDFLHGLSNDRMQAGHQLKHLGVIWKNLSVEVKFLLLLLFNYN